MATFQPGIHSLLGRNRRWLTGARVGLVSHLAAVDSRGTTSAELLLANDNWTLTALFGPEHGFIGAADAGASVPGKRHPVWKIPIHSLYGSAKKPAPDMLAKLDLLVLDLQDLGFRPYTYVSTLRYLLEAAAEYSKPLIVADRPVPLPFTVDGPLPEPDFISFVAAIPAPMAYGMTPGETALWLRHKLGLDLDLRVAKMSGYRRQTRREPDWPPWVPPSPGIRSWETAQTYLATLFGESLHTVNIGRGSNAGYQVFGSAWMKSAAVLENLLSQKLPGVCLHSHLFQPAGRAGLLDGVRLTIVDAKVFRPVTTSLAILQCLQELYGPAKLWRVPQERLNFFDKLYGTPQTRQQLLSGKTWQQISSIWQTDSRLFKLERKKFLLY